MAQIWIRREKSFTGNEWVCQMLLIAWRHKAASPIKSRRSGLVKVLLVLIASINFQHMRPQRIINCTLLFNCPSRAICCRDRFTKCAPWNAPEVEDLYLVLSNRRHKSREPGETAVNKQELSVSPRAAQSALQDPCTTAPLHHQSRWSVSL